MIIQSKRCLGFFVALTMFSGLASRAEAQTNFLYSFTGNATGNPTSGTSANVNAGAFSIGNPLGTVTTPINSTSPSSGYTTASGVSASGGNNIGNATKTGALSISSSSYFAFTLTPSAGLAVQLTGLNFGERSTGTGALTFAIYSSEDNFTTAIGNPVTVLNNSTYAAYNFGTLNFTSASADSAITFRLYAYGGTGTATNNTITTRLDDITVIADGVTPVPEPATFLGGFLMIGALGWNQRRRLGGIVGSLRTARAA